MRPCITGSEYHRFSISGSVSSVQRFLLTWRWVFRMFCFLKKVLLSSRAPYRDGYLWNTAGSLLNAFQSVFFLMLLTRTADIAFAGVFTIAYADANLFLNIGKYGMRYYQVSDVSGQFSFRTYRNSRILTTALMLAVSAGYTLYAARTYGYTSYKAQVVLWMCIQKSVDAVEDVYHGMYQQRGRLDVAAKCMTLRMLAVIVVFAVTTLLTGDLLAATVWTTVCSAALCTLLLRAVQPAFVQAGEPGAGTLRALLSGCFSLFLGAFLSFYIGNAPKYSIDHLLSDEVQACYGFIAMPVFIIGLLSSVIYNPIIVKASLLWKERRVAGFLGQVARQVLVIAGITAVCEAGAWLIGIPVLSILYNTDLSAYRAELLIMLLGGGFLALSTLLATFITVIRFQRSVAVCYGIVAAAAFLLSDRVVAGFGVMGASVLYTALMAFLCVCFLAAFVAGVTQCMRREML